MATTSKREQMREGMSRSRRRHPSSQRVKTMKTVVTPGPKPLEKVMFVIEPSDLAWLNTAVTELKAVRRRTSKSELMRLAIAIMKKMDPEELRQQLRELD
jgi:hypothetical protein